LAAIGVREFAGRRDVRERLDHPLRFRQLLP
jgi:hypothetical protein